MKSDSSQNNKILNTAFPLAILACIVSGFWPAFSKLVIRWSTDDNNYCYLIVPLFFYLCWEKRGHFKFMEFSWSPWGILPAIPSVALLYLGELGSVETMLYAGLWGCAAALAITLYGKRATHLFFPLLILLFIVPLPPFINRIISFKMKMMASALSAEMLRATGISVLLEGNIIDLGIDRLNVVDACSGLRYLMPIIIIALLIGHYSVRGLWRWLIILFLIAPVSIILNSFRIYISGILTVLGHNELAQDTFHDITGLVVFLISGVILGVTATALKKGGTQPPSDSWKDSFVSSPGNIRPAILTVCLCILFAGSGLALQKISTVPAHPPRKTFDSFPMEIGGWHGQREFLSKEILDSLWADDYLKAVYQKEGSASPIYLLIPFYEYQGTRHTAHAPQSCLLGGGFNLLNSRKILVTVPSGRQIEIMTLYLVKDEDRMLASYFFLQRGRVITNPWYNKFYLMWDAITEHRTDGALVRVELGMAPGQDIDDAYGKLTAFVAQLWPILSEYVPE